MNALQTWAPLLPFLLMPISCADTDDLKSSIVGRWEFAGTTGAEYTTFGNDGAVEHRKADGRVIRGRYQITGDSAVHIMDIDGGDTTDYRWLIDIEGDRMIVTLSNGGSIDLRRADE